MKQQIYNVTNLQTDKSTEQKISEAVSLKSDKSALRQIHIVTNLQSKKSTERQIYKGTNQLSVESTNIKDDHWSVAKRLKDELLGASAQDPSEEEGQEQKRRMTKR